MTGIATSTHMLYRQAWQETFQPATVRHINYKEKVGRNFTLICVPGLNLNPAKLISQQVKTQCVWPEVFAIGISTTVITFKS